MLYYFPQSRLNMQVPGLLTQSAFALKILEAKVTEDDKL
jgi:hypothetical protein